MSAPAVDNLEVALSYGERFRWHVFPVWYPNGTGCACGVAGCDSAAKHPVTPNGFKDATNFEAPIRRWWTRHPLANIGLSTGRLSGVVVLDVDPRHRGDESLAKQEAAHGPLPVTVESLTGGGGRHLFFKAPGHDVGCATGLLPGLDRKADGGYIILPPSRHKSGGSYAWREGRAPRECELAEAPAWFLGSAMRETKRPGPVADVIPEGMRHETLKHETAKYRAAGLKGEPLFDVVQGENLRRCDPPLPDHEVRKLVAHFDKKDGATLEGPPEDLERFTSIDVGGYELIHKEIPKPESIIGDGVLSRPDLGFLVGPGGVGKSQLIVQFAVARALGTEWLGFKVAPGRTGLFMLELSEFWWQQRIRATAGERAGEALDSIRIICRPTLKGLLDLSTEDEMRRLRRWIEARDLSLIALDPLSRSHSLNENEIEQMGPFLQRLDALRYETNCALLINHHTRKSQSKGRDSDLDAASGTRAFRDFPSFFATLGKKRNLRVLSFPKVSHAAEPPPVTLAKLDNGVLEVSTAPERQAEKGDATRRRVHAALWKIGRDGAKSKDIATELDVSDTTAKNHLAGLEEDGKARKDGKGPATRWYPCGEEVADV